MSSFDPRRHPRGGDPTNPSRFSDAPRAESTIELPPASPPGLLDLLESAARLQQLVPDAVLVGGSAAAMYAGHRISFDHDHVLADLRERFDTVLDALEREGEWVTNRVAYGKIVLGQIGDIEAGVRQLIRKTPLEVSEVELPSGATLRVPTLPETLRVKAFLIVKRNQVRDYLDTAALADAIGRAGAAEVLAGIDEYYSDGQPEQQVSSQLLRQLSDPRPADSMTVRELDRYKNLDARWRDWDHVRSELRELSRAITEVTW
ncbi:MAG: hypothetical protein ACRCYU_02315 [Nocardioides sp.]